MRVTYDQERGVWFDEDGQETSHQTPAVWAEYISGHPYTWRFSPTEEGLIAHMKAAFLRGEKLAIFTTTQSDVEGLARALKKLHPEAKGLLVHGGLGLEERRPGAALPLHEAQKNRKQNCHSLRPLSRDTQTLACL